ncbi:MAG: thiamine pyrophosphate-binding protein [Acetobacteraceae bacterium]|nr:thiamine pyrophosphate-binding protein [Acetobacteraceae bacterium]MDW8397765.1 thiamine pyrophosphate-binding protein [Acetobacteraceae bacterium]
MADATRRTVAEAVVEGLLANGIGTVFALPGVQNDPFFDALFHARDRIRVIHPRHEQAAGYMALGAALATGRPQAMSVVPGPGLLNAAAALATAYSCNAPVFSIVGQIPLHAIGRRRGELHEIEGQSAILATLSGWSGMARAAAEVPGLVEAAFRAMLSGRPRPAALEVPMDVWRLSAPLPPQRAALPDPPPPVDGDAVERAAALLGAAERPMLIAGGGALDCGAELRAIAEALDSPLLSFRMGRGVLDSRHPLDLRPPVAHRLWGVADAVLAVGTRASVAFGGWGTAGLKVVRIEADAEEIGRFGAPDVALHGDARAILPVLRAALPARPRPPWRAAVEQAKAEVMGRIAARLAPQAAILQAIRDVLPEDGVLVNELTQIGYAAGLLFPVPAPRRFLSSGAQGTLGWGFGAALGAKAVLGPRPVLSIAGDGGFLFQVQELATAVQHRIPLVTVVFNDNAFGNVRLFQDRLFGGRRIASDLVNPDFVRLAESFGAQGLRAETPEALRRAIARGFATTDRPTLIEMPIGELPSPWEFILLPRVRG